MVSTLNISGELKPENGESNDQAKTVLFFRSLHATLSHLINGLCLMILFSSAAIGLSQTNAGQIIQFSESRSLELRMETLNLFNTVNFDLPSHFAGTPNFGKIFSAGPSRQIQFGIKLSL